MIVCQCGPVSDSTIREVVRSGAHTVDDVGDVCGAGAQCGTCRILVAQIVDELLEKVGPGGRGSGTEHG